MHLYVDVWNIKRFNIVHYIENCFRNADIKLQTNIYFWKFCIVN